MDTVLCVFLIVAFPFSPLPFLSSCASYRSPSTPTHKHTPAQLVKMLKTLNTASFTPCSTNLENSMPKTKRSAANWLSFSIVIGLTLLREHERGPPNTWQNYDLNPVKHETRALFNLSLNPRRKNNAIRVCTPKGRMGRLTPLIFDAKRMPQSIFVICVWTLLVCTIQKYTIQKQYTRYTYTRGYIFYYIYLLNNPESAPRAVHSYFLLFHNFLFSWVV